MVVLAAEMFKLAYFKLYYSREYYSVYFSIKKDEFAYKRLDCSKKELSLEYCGNENDGV